MLKAYSYVKGILVSLPFPLSLLYCINYTTLSKYICKILRYMYMSYSSYQDGNVHYYNQQEGLGVEQENTAYFQ